jgi:hypothetical protein
MQVTENIFNGDITIVFKTPEQLQLTGITKSYLNMFNINHRIGYVDSQSNSDVIRTLVLED